MSVCNLDNHSIYMYCIPVKILGHLEKDGNSFISSFRMLGRDNQPKPQPEVAPTDGRSDPRLTEGTRIGLV